MEKTIAELVEETKQAERFVQECIAWAKEGKRLGRFDGRPFCMCEGVLSSIQVYRGLEWLADKLRLPVQVAPHSEGRNKSLFVYEGYEFFQLDAIEEDTDND